MLEDWNTIKVPQNLFLMESTNFWFCNIVINIIKKMLISFLSIKCPNIVEKMRHQPFNFFHLQVCLISKYFWPNKKHTVASNVRFWQHLKFKHQTRKFFNLLKILIHNSQKFHWGFAPDTIHDIKVLSHTVFGLQLSTSQV